MAIPVVLRANSGALTVDLTAGAAPTDVAGAINTTWAGWSGTSSATISHPATINTAWAGWSGTAAATVEHPAIITTTWAGWDGEAVGTVTGGDEPPSTTTGGTPRFTYERIPAPVARNDDDEVLILIAL